MSKQLSTGIIVLLIIVVAGLSFMLIENQKTINEQRTTMATQEQRITQLEGEVKKYEAAQGAVNSAIQSVGGIIKEKGTQVIQEKLQR
jgi:cell division protein FtsB